MRLIFCSWLLTTLFFLVISDLSDLLDTIELSAHLTILVLVVKVVVSFIVVEGPSASVVIACGDAEDHTTPLVQNPLGQILHLRHANSVFGIYFHCSGQFWCVLEEDRLYVKRVNHLKNFLHYFHIWVRAVRERV